MDPTVCLIDFARKDISNKLMILGSVTKITADVYCLAEKGHVWKDISYL